MTEKKIYCNGNGASESPALEFKLGSNNDARGWEVKEERNPSADSSTSIFN